MARTTHLPRSPRAAGASQLEVLGVELVLLTLLGLLLGA
jgi:hypothetical protein